MDLIKLIEEYTPYNEQEKAEKQLILQCINKFDDILLRDNEIVHITSSAFAINEKEDKMLMVHHNIYNSWSWIGGHADGDRDLLAVAIKELKEETGVNYIQLVFPSIFALDILPVIAHVRKGNHVSAHVHLSFTFLVKVNENELLTIKEDENSGVKWVAFEEVIAHTSEPHMKKVYEKLISKVKQQTAR